MSKEKTKPKWILYHLIGMEYFRKKFENKMSKIPVGVKLAQKNKKQLKKIIGEIRENIRDYQKGIEYHREKAMGHIKEDEKTQWVKNLGKKKMNPMNGCF